MSAKAFANEAEIDVRIWKAEADRDWRKLRLQVIKRDKYTCQMCGKRVGPLSAHHIRPREQGGPDTLSNLIALCNPCHDIAEIEGLRNRAAIMGWLNRSSEIVIVETKEEPSDKRMYEGEWCTVEELVKMAEEISRVPPEMFRRRMEWGWWNPYLAVHTPPLLTATGVYV